MKTPKEKWACSKCRKRVYPKHGKLSCCGITEDIEYTRAVEEIRSKNVRRNLSPVLDSIGDKWGLK